MSVTYIAASLRRLVEHRLDSGILVGLTPAGHTTVRLLQFNAPERVNERLGLVASGRYIIPNGE